MTVEIFVWIIFAFWILVLLRWCAGLEEKIEKLEGGNLNSQQRIDRLENANDD